MDNETKLKIEEKIIDMLKTVYDPEIPRLNVYDLGLIYRDRPSGKRRIDHRHDFDRPELPGSRFYYGRCASESRIGGRSDCRYGQSGL